MKSSFPPMYRLTARGGVGLACDEQGIALGPVVLVEALAAGGGRVFRPRPAEEIARTLALAYDDLAPTDVARCLASLDVAAKALEAGDLVKASVAAVLLKLPDLSVEGFAKLADTPSLKKYSPSQPRDGRGRWAGDNSGDGSRQTAQVEMSEMSDEGGTGGRAARTLSISEEGLAFIARHEGFRPNVYMDEANHPTIGFGHKLVAGESFPHSIDEAEARRLLASDVSSAEAAVQRGVASDLTPRQFDALVSFAYNIGGDAFQRSTLLRNVNAGNFNAAAGEFMRWNQVRQPDGTLRPSPGLTNRRRAERDLFLDGIYVDEPLLRFRVRAASALAIDARGAGPSNRRRAGLLYSSGAD
jgi:lysozyme